MRFIVCILMLLFFSKAFSQRVVETYTLKKNDRGDYYKEYIYLYNDGKYFRTRYSIHSGYFSNEKGIWKLNEKSILVLNLKMIKIFPEANDSFWEENERQEFFKKKNNCIIPIYKNRLKRKSKLNLV